MPEWLNKIFGFLPAGLGDIANIVGSVMNYKQQERANETNLQMVRMQNQAAAQESEKAYQRSRASSQVADMMSAGMSKAGALNVINGGGSYTPAPVNAGQVQAPQMDLSNAFSGILQTAENAKQRNMQERIVEKQIKAQKDLQEAQLATQKEIAQLQADTTNRNADNRLAWEKEIYDRLPAYEQKRYDLGIELLEKQVDIEEWRLNDLKYRTLEYQSEPYKTTRDTLNLLQDVAADLDITISQKDLKEFKDTYMYYDSGIDEWRYKEIGNNPASQWTYKNMPIFWDFVSRVIPANKLSDLIARGLSKR